MNLLRQWNKVYRVCCLLLISVMILSVSSCNNREEVFDKHFVHSVYIWLKNPNNPDDRKKFEVALDKFLKTSKYAKTNFVGTPAGTDREVVDNTYTYNIVVTFSSKEEQDLYQKEDAHLLFIEEASSLWNKVQIYDAIGFD